VKRPFLIVALLVGLALGFSVVLGVAWHFMREQAASTAANDARAAEAKIEHPARRAAAETGANETGTGSRFEEHPIEFHNQNVRLSGSLLLPKSEKPLPAVIFVHGAGPQTR
jgi:hypothetical protein